MKTDSLNWGCGLIATAPVFAAHIIFTSEIRYILLSWFCSFISTVLLIFCSLSSLFTKNPWFILLFSIPFDVLGKVVLKYFGCKMSFLQSPRARISLGISCGLGFALAHVLTLFLPIVFDQPYSVDMDVANPDYFPNSLDLALLNHAMSVFHMDIGLILFRFTKVNIFLMYFILLALQYGAASITMISHIWLKHFLLFLISYALFIFACLSYRTMEYEPILNDESSNDLSKEHND